MGTTNNPSISSGSTHILPDDTALKLLIAHHCEEFVGCYLKEHVENLSSLWEFVAPLPVDTLERDIGLAGAGTALGLASTSSNLLGVISTMTWILRRLDVAVKHEQGLTDLIVREAMSRGCSIALGHLLARYWQAQRNQ